MNKRIRVLLLFLFCLLTCSCLVFAEESLIVTTYYPSPDGAYYQLQVNKLAAGDTNGDGRLTFLDAPAANGQIYTARSVIYKPLDSLPNSDLIIGELAYQNSDDELYFYKNSTENWVKLESSDIATYAYYCFDNSFGGEPECADSGNPTQKYCPIAGYTQVRAIGAWGYCSDGTSSYFLPPNEPPSDCGVGYTKHTVGQAYLCTTS